MTSANGTATKAAPETVGPFGEYGRTGLRESAGQIMEEQLPNLRGARGRKIFAQMAENDPVVGAALYALAQLVRRAEWEVEPPDSGDDTHVEFVEGLMCDMSHSWSALIGEIMFGMPVYGHQAHEIVYKRRAGEKPNPGDSSRYSDGLIGWRKLAVRSQETLVRWEFGDDGGLEGMWQSTATGPVLIPVEKLALFRTSTARGNPEGRSALRSAYRPWFLKTRVEEQEAIGIERDLTGIPMFELPEQLLNPAASGTDLAAREAFENIGKNLRRDEQASIMIPLVYDANGNKRYEFSLLASPGTHQVDTQPVITRHNQTIAMTLLADVILLGHEKVGSNALGVTKYDMLAASIDAWVEGIAEVLNRHCLPRLFSLNGMPTGEIPQFCPTSVKPDDVTEMVDQIAKLAQSGMPLWPSEDLEEWVAERVGFPMPDHESMAMMPEAPEPPAEGHMDPDADPER